jgi:hypothetical protein
VTETATAFTMALVYSPEVPSGKTTPNDGPPSPSLTNPDLILPRNPYSTSYSSYASSPSPDRVPVASSPTLHDFTLPTNSSPPDASVATGVPTLIKMPIRAKPLAPSSQYAAFAGYEHGAPLSDIGEEETVASLTPRSRVTRQSRSPSPVHPLSPTPAPKTALPDSTLQRRGSIGAASDGSDEVDWENFDTSTMMSGRLAADVAKEQEREALQSKRNSTISVADGDEVGVLNDRAEQILEDARKRLTNMEDNLSKARNSMLWSPRSSPNISEYHHPAGSLYRSISLAGVSKRYSRPLKDSSPVHARGSSDTTPSGLKRLSMVPERSSSAQEYGRTADSPQYYSRSSPITRMQSQSPASAQSLHSPMRTLDEEESASDPSTTKTSPENHTPKGLGIDTSQKDAVSDLRRSTQSPSLNRSASAASLGRPESAASVHSLRESVSDLRLRIHGIKAKAQADKDRRRSVQRHTPSPFTAQSNPEQWYTSAPEYQQGSSPINANAGEGWSPKHARATSLDAQVTPMAPKTVDLLQPQTPQTAIPLIGTPAGRTDVNTPNLAREAPGGHARDSVIDQSNYEDAAQDLDDEDQVAASEEEQVYLNEVLEESLQDVEPDVPDVPEHLLHEANAERHEDRLDAFDYENMFLHSAMGNYRNSQITDSDSSDTESVETSRADQVTPTAGHPEEDSDEEDSSLVDQEDGDEQQEEEDDIDMDQPGPIPGDFDEMPTPIALVAPAKPWMRPMRTNSVESVSTEASFATATEGSRRGEASDNNDEDDPVPHEILGWGNTTAFPAPPVASPRRSNTPNGNSHHYFPTPPTSARLASPTHNSSGQSAARPLKIVTNSNTSLRQKGMLTPVRSPSNSISTVSAGNTTPNRALKPSLTTSPTSSQARSVVSNGSSANSTPHPANTEILMESLIKLADPDFVVDTQGSQQGRRGTFAEVDKALVLALLREVGTVCNGVLQAERKRDGSAVKGLRRRMDEARAVLEGRAARVSEDQAAADEEGSVTNGAVAQ